MEEEEANLDKDIEYYEKMLLEMKRKKEEKILEQKRKKLEDLKKSLEDARKEALVDNVEIGSNEVKKKSPDSKETQKEVQTTDTTPVRTGRGEKNPFCLEAFLALFACLPLDRP